MKNSTWSIKRILWSILVILLFLNYGCKKENSAVKDAIDKEAINQARKDLDAAWLSKDIDTMIFYSAKDIILLPPNAERITGTEEFRNFLQYFFKNLTMTDLKTLEREVVVSGDLAFERNLYEWVLVPEGVSEGKKDQINFVGIWQRQPKGDWKEIRGIWNSTKPIAGE